MTAATRSIKRSEQADIVPIGRAQRPPVLAVGGQIGRYVLVDKLGQGSFGVIFAARDTVLDRAVAIKILNPAHQYNADLLRRFLQEALASARVVHPGIVTVHDFGTVPTTTGETAFIVLELLQGESLTARLARTGRFTVPWALEVVRQVASALDTAHRAGVLHRDLKSENIYLVPDPAATGGERIKVLDFGLAKVGASRHTQLGTVFGTPRYMSPEQCRSATNIDERSDIYSLGCVLFELLTGRTPFSGDIHAQLEGHKRAITPRASQFVPDLPPAVDELVAQMLAKNPEERPQSMQALHAMLHSLLSSGAPAAPHATFGLVGYPVVAATMLPVAAEQLAPVRSPIARLSEQAIQFSAPIHQQHRAIPAIPVGAAPAPLPRSKRRSSQQPAPAFRGDHKTTEPAAILDDRTTQAAAIVSLPRTPSVKYHLAPHLPSLKRSPVRASIVSLAITLVIATVLTAVAARGQIQRAAASAPPPAAERN